jgi:hypothetical protein
MTTVLHNDPATGGPGIDPRWTRSDKDGVGSAYSALSRVWFTVSKGILNEVYYPTIDRPQVRDLQYLVTDGETFCNDERRMHNVHEWLAPHALTANLMTPPVRVVFLLDVDNTLLDNDRIVEDLKLHLIRAFGAKRQERYWAIFEQLREELGYTDYLGALQRYRAGDPCDACFMQLSCFMVDYHLPSPGTLCPRLRGTGDLPAGRHHGRVSRRSAPVRPDRVACGRPGRAGQDHACRRKGP